MKKLQIILAVALLFTACKTGDKQNAENQNEKAETASETPRAGATLTENAVTFKVDGEQVINAVHNLGRSDMVGLETLNITSSMWGNDKRTILINVNLKKTGTGVYPVGKFNVVGNCYGIYYPEYGNTYTQAQLKSGQVEITKIDTVNNLLECTFNFNALTEDGKQISITDGQVVKGKLAQGIEKFK